MENNEIKPVDWAITLFVASLPLIGLVLLFVWAFGDNSNPIKQNFAKGYLLFLAFGLIIGMIILSMFSGLIFSQFSEAF